MSTGQSEAAPQGSTGGTTSQGSVVGNHRAKGVGWDYCRGWVKLRVGDESTTLHGIYDGTIGSLYSLNRLIQGLQ